jgi:hypothetical protein
VVSENLAHRIEVSALRASYDELSGGFFAEGVGFLSGMQGMSTAFRFELDAHFGSDGTFDPDQKGSFSITKMGSSVVLLKGTITEARGSVFGNPIRMRATSGVGGEFAPLYQNEVALTVNLNRIRQSRVVPTLYSFSGFQAMGTAVIGIPVPEPSSFLALASALVVGGSSARRARRRRSVS